MLYKHLTALVFSKAIGDSEPDENWYEIWEGKRQGGGQKW